MKNALLIINPVAGRKRASKVLEDVKAVFLQNGIKTTEYFTQKSKDALLKAEECAFEYDAVICIGGDGTLNEVISGIAKSGSKTPVGYIPTGTTNDLASTLGISKDAKTAALDIINGKEKEIDIGKLNESYFTYIASFGAFTASSHSTSQALKNAFGHSAYLLSSVRELFNIKPYKARITADGVCFEDEYMFGAVCNSTSIGGLFKLDEKQVDMSDGVFEIVLAKMVKDPITLLKRVDDFKKRRYPSEHIQFFKASEVTFEFEKETDWALDGECARGTRTVTVKNLNKKIKLILK